MNEGCTLSPAVRVMLLMLLFLLYMQRMGHSSSRPSDSSDEDISDVEKAELQRICVRLQQLRPRVEQTPDGQREFDQLIRRALQLAEPAPLLVGPPVHKLKHGGAGKMAV